MKKVIGYLSAVVLLVQSLGAAEATPERLKVVATFLPYYSHAKQIAGDKADVESLLDRGTGPHDFQFKPSDVKKLAKANLLIANGLGLEEWLEPMIKKAANPKLIVVRAGEGGANVENPKEIEIPGVKKDHEHHEGCDHGDGANPHVWLDPVLAQDHVKKITEAFVAADSANAAVYRANAERYLAELVKLDQEFNSVIGSLKSKNLITFHDAFPYLANRYGLNYLGYIEAFPEKSPSPKALSGLIDVIKKNQVKVLFAESGYTPKLLASIAKQTGASVASLDTLEVGELTADGYLTRMRSNLNSLKKSLGE